MERKASKYMHKEMPNQYIMNERVDGRMDT